MQKAHLTNCGATKNKSLPTALVSVLNTIMRWSVPLWATLASSGLHATRSSSGGGGGGRCLQGNLWYSPPASMTSRLASVTFKMASKVLIEESDKNFDFIYCHRKLDLSTFWNEMSSGVMNFKDSFLSSSKFYGQLYRPVTLLRASTQLDWGV